MSTQAENQQQIQNYINEFVSKYGATLRFGTDRHVEYAASQLRDNEIVEYAFVGKLSTGGGSDTFVFVLTNQRLLISRKDKIVGATSQSIKLENIQDVASSTGMRYGQLQVQTIKTSYYITGLDKDALVEISDQIMRLSDKAQTKKQKSSGAGESERLLKKLINIKLGEMLKDGLITKEDYEKMLEK